MRRRIAKIRENISAPHDIVGRDQYTSTAILVPLVMIEGEECFLLEKRAAHIYQGGELCFPGGHYESGKDSSPLETALRETVEELGIAKESIEIIGRLDTLVSPRGIIVDCFLGFIDIKSKDEFSLDEDEVADVLFVPLSWLRDNPPEKYHTRVEIQASYTDKDGVEKELLPVEDLGLPGRYKKNRSEWLSRVFVYHFEEEILWGLTASVVENTMRKYFY